MLLPIAFHQSRLIPLSFNFKRMILIIVMAVCSLGALKIPGQLSAGWSYPGFTITGFLPFCVSGHVSQCLILIFTGQFH